MTAVNNINVTVLVSVVCLGLAMIFVGGWYFQSSLAELKDQQQEAAKEIQWQREQLIKLQLQLQLTKTDQVTNEVFINNMTIPERVLKRSATDNSSPNENYIKILRGRDGRDGRDGSPGTRGMVGPPGPKGDAGAPGPKGDGAGGVVYVRWGHNSCPNTTGAQLVYAGRAGGSDHLQKGGGSNPQCLPLDPTFYKTISGVRNHGQIYGAEYQHTSPFVPNSHDTDVPCAVCYVPTRNALYMIPAKYTCPSGWTTEYFGYLMSEFHNHHRSQFTCLDHNLISVIGSHHDRNGLLFYTVEGVCGSLPCPPYTPDKELSCAVCTK